MNYADVQTDPDKIEQYFEQVGPVSDRVKQRQNSLKAAMLSLAKEVNKKTDVIRNVLDKGVLPTITGDQFFYLIRASDVPPDLKLKFMGGEVGIRLSQQIRQSAQQYDPRTRLQKALEVSEEIKNKEIS